MDQSTQTKRCARCHEVQPLENFGVNRANRDALQYHCKACCKAAREAMTDEQRQRKREINAAYMARQRELRRDELNAAVRAFAAANPERIREYRKRFRENSPEKFAAIRERDRAASRERARLWTLANPEANRSKGHRRRALERGTAVGPIDYDALWTGACGICGGALDAALKYPDPLSRSVDHILPLSRGGSHAQDNVQWAHLVCNLRKYVKSP